MVWQSALLRGTLFCPVMQGESYEQFYADEIRLAANLTSRILVDAFANVRREAYLGPAPWQICSADQAALALMGLGGEVYSTSSNARDLYHNVLVAIDSKRYLNNGQPSTLARWIAALDLKPDSRVFHVGCGVGYYTAIMAEVVGPRGNVVAIEIDPELAARAKENLASYSQVSVFAGDGADFDPGMCDAMLINAGVTHPHRPWLERLTEGGSLVVPLTCKGGENYGSGVVFKITRAHEEFPARVVSLVAIFSSASVRDPEMEPLLAKALAKRELRTVRSLRLREHAQAETCVVHGRTICLSRETVITAGAAGVGQSR